MRFERSQRARLLWLPDARHRKAGATRGRTERRPQQSRLCVLKKALAPGPGHSRLRPAASCRCAPHCAACGRQPRMDRLHRRQHFCRGRPAEHGHGRIRVPAPSAACARLFAYERRASRKGGLTCSADRAAAPAAGKTMDALTAAQYQTAVDALAPRLAELPAHRAVAQLPAVPARELSQRFPVQH